MCRDKIAPTLFFLIIIQVLTGESKTLTRRKTSRKLDSLPNDTCKDIDILKTYCFPQNDYPLFQAYSTGRSQTCNLEKYPCELLKQSSYTQYPKKRRKSKYNKFNNNNKYSCDRETILQNEPFCYNMKNAFPMVEYPLEVSEIWKPTYWRTLSQDIPVVAATSSTSNQRKRKNRIRNNCTFKDFPKKESRGKCISKTKSSCNTSPMKCELLDYENQKMSNFSSISTCPKNSVNSNDSLIIITSENPVNNECEKDIELVCFTEEVKKADNNESCLLDDSEYIFIPNDKNTHQLFLSTPAPFSTTESCDFNTDAVPLE